MIWVAEIGSNHGGSKALAYELIRQARLSGATIAKFQFGWTAEAQSKYAGEYDSRRFVDDWAQDLKKWCDDLDIELMASIWSMEGLEVARSVGMKRYKIAHQIEDRALLDAILSDGKQVFWSNEPIDNRVGVELVVSIRADSSYPSYKMNVPNDFSASFDKGYSSHMHGIADALIAVSRGAHYIEKHFSLSNYAGFPKDAAFSLTPPEFRQMVDIGNEIARLL